MRLPDRAVVPLLVAGAVGVVLYVGTWAWAGAVTPGYDPLRQAISELFAIGAPSGPRWALTVILVVTGLGLGPMGFALERTLPARGMVGPLLIALSAVMIGLVGLFPCTATCPGWGASTTDTLHSLTAAIGYLALIVAPIAYGVRLRVAMPGFATASLLLGGIALVGFALRYAGVVDLPLAGLQQRVLNTVADAWYVLAAVVGVRRWRGVGGNPECGPDTV